MDDAEIIRLYCDRNEDAVKATEEKYGAYLMKVAMNILNDEEDAREAVNDTYYKAWCTIHEHPPDHLLAYLTKLLRRTAIDIFKGRHRKKRQNMEYALSLSELEECLSAGNTTEEAADYSLLKESIDRFLGSLSEEALTCFLGRYYYCDSMKEISRYLGVSEAKVKTMLYRTRQSLKQWLEKEGYII